MVTPAMQQPQTIYGPNGERADWNGREYVVASPAAPAAQGGSGFRLQPMVTPAEQRAREEREYDRSRDTVRDQLTASREERAIDAAQRSADTAERAAEKLTEDQGKAGGYAQLMADAERSYQEALREGFNPTGFRAGLANFTDNVPFMGGVGNFIRDDAGDRARQAELQWSDAQLKAMSGAASPEQEVVRNNITFFARPGQNYGYLGERLEEARRVAFESSKRRAGRDLQGLAYPDTDPSAPAGRPGEVAATAINYRDPNSANALAALIEGGGWIRDGDGEPYYVGPGGIQMAPPQEGDEATAPGVRMRPQAGLQAQIEDRSNVPDWWRNVESFAQAATERLPGVDEAAAWTAAKLAGTDYQSARNVQSDVADYDRQNYRTARNAGGVAGTVAPLVVGAGAPLRIVQGATRAGRALNAAAGAGVVGTAVGAGEGEGGLGERSGNALTYGATAAALGPVAQPVANALSRGVVQPVTNAVQGAGRWAGRQAVNALGDNAPTALREASEANPLASGMDRFADRMGPDRINALSPRVISQRDLGMEPTLIDALDDASVGRVRALATRDTPARDGAVRFAEGRRNNLPSRTARIAREEISSDARPALDILDAQRAARRANASSIETFGADPVPVSDDLISALRSDFVKPHLRAAAQRAQGALDPADREASARLSQIADMALDNPNGVGLTVRDAQDISKALNDAAQTAFRNGSPDGPVLRDLANAVRGSARENSEGYAAWLQRYGEDSDLIEAATTGRNFVSVSTDPVNARSTEAFVRGAEGASATGRDIMRASAREAVEVAASNPSGARTTLDRFASDTDQARRAQALGVNADRLQARSQAEINAVTAAQRASPRVGSESSTNLQDAGDAAGGVIDAIRRPMATAFGAVINRVASRGFNNAEAEAIVTAAQNPARADELIGMLSQRMNRREARNLARALRYQLATSPQSGQQPR